MTSPGQLAQRLHDKWCEHMREKGFHGFLEKCPSSPECNLPYYKCEKYRVGICDYALIGTIWQQEYLATAKAVLPEIERGITLVENESRRVGAEIKKLAKLGGTEKDELLREIWNLASQLCPDDTR